VHTLDIVGDVIRSFLRSRFTTYAIQVFIIEPYSDITLFKRYVPLIQTTLSVNYRFTCVFFSI